MKKFDAPLAIDRSTKSKDSHLPTISVRFGIRESAAILGISRAQLYVRIQEGAISAHKDGARTFISQVELERYVRACEERSELR